ncbi:MAG: hypothetical protein IJ091_11310 [Oscillospiraceae bacterium]|nr:hypothetical protein [Oscillospiraceae bacterium]MBQ8996387.1 hypothetical protein [Oscillospiraceae bacterium]
MENITLNEIIEAITIIGVIIGFFKSLKGIKDGYDDMVKNQALRDERLEERLDRIEKRLDNTDRRLDEHNNYGEKFVENTLTLTEITTDLKWIKEKLK